MRALNSEKIATARVHYQAARDELVMRVRFRDQVLLVYLPFVGAMSAVALGVNKPEILLAIPYVALGCAIIVSQHNNVVGSLIAFINTRVKRTLEVLEAGAPEFTSSSVFHGHSLRSNRFRSIGHAVIILAPCGLALGVNWKELLAPFPLGIAWWFGLVSTGFAGWVIRYVHKLRTEVYDKTPWETENQNT